MALLGGIFSGASQAQQDELQAVTRYAAVPACIVQIYQFDGWLSAALSQAKMVTGGMTSIVVPVQGAPLTTAAAMDFTGYLAWGIVPTSPKITGVSSNDLVKRLEEGIQFLVNKGVSKTLIKERSIITPSCGAGTLTIGEAERVMSLTHEVSTIMKNKSV